ncbi:MAG: branched-chain amino acid ABC transporter permease [Alphaproteobacteria bacterium]
MIYREAGQFRTSYAADQALFPIRQDRIFVWAALLVAFAIVPFVASEYLLRAILIPFLILATAAIGLNLLVGYCGQISLGSAAFMAIGAYASYNLALHFPWLNLLVVFVLGGLFAAGAGVLFGLPSLRIKGYYLAVATLAAQFFFDWLFIRVPWFTGYASSGSVSAPPLVLFGLRPDSPAGGYLLCLALLCVIALAARNIVRGRIGRMWMAIRDMDIAAEIIGISPLRAKLLAFAVSSFVIGVAGALWAFVHLGSWEPLAFSIERSFELLFMVVIGGLGSIAGAFLGAAFITMLPIFLNQLPTLLGIPLSTAMILHLEQMIFGALIVFFLIVEPRGLARLWAMLREKLRLWPFPH